MSDTPSPDPSGFPRLWKRCRIGFDEVRHRPVLLYPEGAMFINDTGREILRRCDGSRTLQAIADELGSRYQADVLADVQEYVAGMVGRELLEIGAVATPPATIMVAPEAERPTPAAPSRQQPTTLLAELTHRCPLHCPYCSNPIELIRAGQELSTEDWQRVFAQARELGVLQLGLSGGEPLVRKDLEDLVAQATSVGLYTTLVTSGLGLTRKRAEALKAAGLDHVQVSIQDADDDNAERIAGVRSVRQKREAAALVRELDFAFSVNVVLHRANLDRIGPIIDLAGELGAERLELANTQYYGWGLKNRDVLMPSRAQLDRAQVIATEAMERYRDRMRILYVLPDYYQEYPKPCYGGWGAVYLVATPDGTILPCHAANSISSLHFPSARDHHLRWIWEESPGFNAFRGDGWMKDPCRTCPRKHLDFGGCRCQAFALTGDAANADPVCTLTPQRHLIDEAVARAADGDFLYRDYQREPVGA